YRGAARRPSRYKLRHISGLGSARFVLRGEPFHGAGLRCRLTPRLTFDAQLLGLEPFGLPAGEFIKTPALHVGIEHVQCSAAGVDLVVMVEIGESFEDTGEVLVP